MVFVQGLALVPTAYLFLAPAFANMDPSLEEAAMASGAGTWTLIRRIMLPILWPSILSAAIFLLIVSLVVFDVPGALGIPARLFVLSSQIYYLVANSPGGIPLYGQVSALAMLFLGILLGLGFAYHRLTRHAQRYRTVTGKGFRPRIFPLGRGRPFAIAALVLYFLLSVVAPLLILLWMSLMPYQTGISWAAFNLLTLDNHRDFLQNARVLTATRNSLVIAVVAATGVCAAVAAGFMAHDAAARAGTAGARHARLHSDRRSRRDDRCGADLCLHHARLGACRSTARSGSSRSPTSRNICRSARA